MSDDIDTLRSENIRLRTLLAEVYEAEEALRKFDSRRNADRLDSALRAVHVELNRT